MGFHWELAFYMKCFHDLSAAKVTYWLNHAGSIFANVMGLVLPYCVVNK